MATGETFKHKNDKRVEQSFSGIQAGDIKIWYCALRTFIKSRNDKGYAYTTNQYDSTYHQHTQETRTIPTLFIEWSNPISMLRIND